MLCYYFHVKKYKKGSQGTSRVRGFRDITPLVTLTCHKTVLGVHGTAEKHCLCSLLCKTGEAFTEPIKEDHKDKLPISLMVYHT